MRLANTNSGALLLARWLGPCHPARLWNADSRSSRCLKGWPTLVSVAALLLMWTARAGCQVAADTTLQGRMQMYARARQFHDEEALGLLFPAVYVSHVQDTVAARYSRFHDTYPYASLQDTTPQLRTFVNEFSPTADGSILVAFLQAFQSLRDGDQPPHAALVILGALFLPPRAISVDQSSFVPARRDQTNATFYLTEVWTIPFGAGSITKRYVVDWFFSDGRWMLNDIH